MESGKIVILIPAYCPGAEMVPYIREIRKLGYAVIVVNDGSGEKYSGIFEQLRGLEQVNLLEYQENKGKGFALKAGIHFALQQGFTDCVTADADGQHAPRDVDRMAQLLLETGENILCLGVRDLHKMPGRSRFGNTLTGFLFHLFYGISVADTQTGLRGLKIAENPELAELPGNRYEYEMHMLIWAGRKGVPIRTLQIETIYEEKNKSSHFRPIADSWKIYRVLFGNVPTFLISSLISFCVDYLLFALFETAGSHRYVIASTVLARAFSSLLNYTMNKHYVFRDSRQSRYNLLHYYQLAVMILAANCGLIYLLTQVIHLNSLLAKPIVEALLYLISYAVQNRLAHTKKKRAV